MSEIGSQKAYGALETVRTALGAVDSSHDSEKVLNGPSVAQTDQFSDPEKMSNIIETIFREPMADVPGRVGGRRLPGFEGSGSSNQPPGGEEGGTTDPEKM